MNNQHNVEIRKNPWWKLQKPNSIHLCIGPLGEKMTQNYRKWVKFVINSNKTKNYYVVFDFLLK